jgi:vacuolar-type H+-ATPase subunit E/Vma4
MFTDQSGRFHADAEVIAERIKHLPEKDVEALNERKAILRDALNSFNERLQGLPERERNATLSLFYKEVTDTLFNFHLSIETSASREKIARAQTKGKKSEALREFQVTIADLTALYGIA